MKERKYAVFSAALASLLLLNSINPILADDTTKGLRNQLKDIQGQLSNAHAKKTNAEAIILSLIHILIRIWLMPCISGLF